MTNDEVFSRSLTTCGTGPLLKLFMVRGYVCQKSLNYECKTLTARGCGYLFTKEREEKTATPCSPREILIFSGNTGNNTGQAIQRHICFTQYPEKTVP